MRDGVWTRRDLLSVGVGAAGACAAVTAGAAAQNPLAHGLATWTFYDPRFADSERLAAALPGAGQLHPVGSDPTPLLGLVDLERGLSAPILLQGVTTEVVPFCLEHSVDRHHRLEGCSRRVDGDLFAWSLIVHPRPSAA